MTHSTVSTETFQKINSNISNIALENGISISLNSLNAKVATI